MWCLFLCCRRLWRGMIELHRRWTDLTRFFVVVSCMGCIASVYSGRRVGGSSYGRYKGRYVRHGWVRLEEILEKKCCRQIGTPKYGDVTGSIVFAITSLHIGGFRPSLGENHGQTISKSRREFRYHVTISRVTWRIMTSHVIESHVTWRIVRHTWRDYLASTCRPLRFSTCTWISLTLPKYSGINTFLHTHYGTYKVNVEVVMRSPFGHKIESER